MFLNETWRKSIGVRNELMNNRKRESICVMYQMGRQMSRFVSIEPGRSTMVWHAQFSNVFYRAVLTSLFQLKYSHLCSFYSFVFEFSSGITFQLILKENL